jgi:DNA polymerase I-like protein with 3'-5' exonuclease and polymerase domains
MRYEIISRPRSGIQFPKVISLDTEYSEKNIRKAKLLSISIGVSPDLTYILEDFRSVKRFTEEAEVIFTWNGVVDHFMLQQSGFGFDYRKILDGMLLEHLIDERLDHGLGDFALREYDDNYKAEFWGKYQTYQEAPKEEAHEYEMRDGCYTYRAGVKYLGSLGDRMDLVQHVHRLQWALFDTEIRGLRVDRELMQRTKEEMGGKISEYLPKLREEFDDECKVWELQKWKQEINKRVSDRGRQNVPRPVFKFTSDRQISDLLFAEEHLGIPVREKTKKGSPSTSFEALKSLSEDYPKLRTLVDYKETKAVYATFVEGMLERVEDGRIYPGFFINGTATGRISHNHPNMGNLPKNGVIRNFFVPDEGRSIVGADYSQLEVVVEANLTEDPSLLKIILEGASKHDITAQGLGLPRDQAKTLNFALQYGAGTEKVAKLLGVSRGDAQDIFDRYWSLYAGVRDLKERTTKTLRDTGSVTNLFGRTRHFDKPTNQWEALKQERQAYNFLIQGVGADITNRATYLISEEFKRRDLGRLLFSVHDEVITESKDSCIEESKSAIVKCMDEPNDFLKLKYRVQSKLYGPLPCWSKA